MKRSGKPFKTVINKVDRFQETDMLMADFYQLGITEIMPISVEHQTGVEELVEWWFERTSREVALDERIRIANRSTIANTNTFI